MIRLPASCGVPRQIPSPEIGNRRLGRSAAQETHWYSAYVALLWIFVAGVVAACGSGLRGRKKQPYSSKHDRNTNSYRVTLVPIASITKQGRP
jgi:hypothetical protein